MKKSKDISAADKASLHKRYLFWLYRMTREELDKIDRKFTQLDVDKEIQKSLNDKIRGLGAAFEEKLSPFLKEWKEYVFQKESDAQKLKFAEDGQMDPQYLFLRLKLEAIEQAAKARFGSKGLAEFKKLYEESAFKRILEDTSGKR